MPRRKPTTYASMLVTAILVAALWAPSLLTELGWMERDAADAALRTLTTVLLLPAFVSGLAVLVLALVSAIRQDLMTVGRVLLWGVLLALALTVSGESPLGVLGSAVFFGLALVLPGVWLRTPESP